MDSFVVFWGLLLSFLLYIIVSFNSLIRKKNFAEEGWSGIDIQLKRRHNLIPNLVETIKGFIGHEKEVILKVTELRAQCMKANEEGEAIKKASALENQLSQGINSILALAENYPNITSNESFVHLQNQLVIIEEEIQMARRYYNGTIRDYNICVESFPSNLVAKTFRFTTKDFFQIEDSLMKRVPNINLQEKRVS